MKGTLCFNYNGNTLKIIILIWNFKNANRYLVISWPIRKPTRRWAVFVSLLAWLYSAAFASLPLFGVGKYVPEGYLTGCGIDYLSNDPISRIFILIFVIGAWMVPMIIIVCSYSSIIWTVCHSRRNITEIADGILISTIIGLLVIFSFLFFFYRY